MSACLVKKYFFVKIRVAIILLFIKNKMENSYFSQEHGVNYIQANKSKKKTVPVSTFVVSLIMVAALVTIIFLKWSDIMWFFGAEPNLDEVVVYNWLSVGDEVTFSWDIFNNWDMVNYTHTYNSKEYGTIWLKSSKLNLNNYSKDVYFEWVVEKIYRETPIVTVITIYNLEIDEPEFTWENEELTESWNIVEANQRYFANLWLFFGEDFFQKYSLVNEWDWSSLKIKNLETNVIYSINYFKCNTTRQSSENCEYLTDFYSLSSTKLVDKYWVTYFKDMEVNSRFFANDLVFGYKINDVDESFVRDLSVLMTVVNKNFVEKNVLPKVWSLCVVNHLGIEKVEKTDLSYKNGDFYYNVWWFDSKENKIDCELKIDPTLSNLAQVVSVSVNENASRSWDIASWINDDIKEIETWDNTQTILEEKKETYIWDTNVEQFPINLEKKLTFTSSRGHSFIFPSSNIAYQWVTASEDFGQVGVNCYSAMNVVKYADKLLVETQGNVVIYECTVKNTFDDSDKTLIYKKVWERNFVIQIVDPAWVDFANNIEIVA